MGIQEYLYDLLNNQLKDIKYRYREKIVDDIKNRMCSLLLRWQQEDFRKTVLFVTDEEALFYEPIASDDVRRFVVATIRNSMLEIAASVNCDQFKMQEPLSNEKIKSITSNAIRYFEQCKFEDLQNETINLKFVDVYEEAIQKYPLAWTVLKRAAVLTDTEDLFEKENETDPENVGEVFDEKKFKKAVCDGYSLEFDDYLKEVLGNVIEGRVDIFYVDCFKGVSRNFEKILHVLQIVLQSGKAFVTCNYYISDGRIEKRRKILRAFHSEKDILENVRNFNGLPPFFKSVLKEMDFGRRNEHALRF